MTHAPRDLIIIGAGIHGAGIALAAARAGYSVLALEKTDIAAGTSSRSSKLIHGGLRYLESAQFSLVYECLRQRQALINEYPDLVKMEPFYIPIYPSSRRPSWKIAFGLLLYAVLSGGSRYARFRRMRRSQWPLQDHLNSTHLKTVYQYWDARTDDAELTRRVWAEAGKLGVELKTHARVEHINLDPGRCTVDYRQDSNSHTRSATVVINAAGPWCNEVLQLANPAPRPMEIELVQGCHIIIDRPLRQGIYYVESPADQRAVFIMPWANKTLVGTTETPYTGAADQVQALQSEIDYLYQCYMQYFPTPAPGPAIVDSFAGLRVLPKSEGNIFHRSRETVLHCSGEGHLLTVYGGKLTAFRATADKVLRTIEPLLKKRSTAGL